MLQQLRISLTRADAVLEDASSIISGYLNMHTQAASADHQAIPEAPQGAVHQDIPPPPYNPTHKKAQMMSNRPIGAPSLPPDNPFANGGNNKRGQPPFSLEQLQKTVKKVSETMEGDESTDIQARLKKISEALKNENPTENTDKTV